MTSWTLRASRRRGRAAAGTFPILAGVAALALAVAALIPPAAQAKPTQRCYPSNRSATTRVFRLPKIADVRVTEQTCVIKFAQGNDARPRRTMRLHGTPRV